MKYLVAVSGGVDSVVLLDMLVQGGGHELIVAHFDHGIRPDSAADARFVGALAAMYHLPFVTKREELGTSASEESARSHRYAFLREMAAKHDAIIATAHHADDVIETIAINISRGTGWRGAAILMTPGTMRPLLGLTKQEIRTYAGAERLEWVEDSTNASNVYLRNRIRRLIALRLSWQQREKLLNIWKEQVVIKKEIDAVAAKYVEPSGEYSRYLFTYSDPIAAYELLRVAIIARRKAGITRPQLERALLAVKTARSGSTYEIGSGITLRFTSDTFVVETP